MKNFNKSAVGKVFIGHGTELVAAKVNVKYDSLIIPPEEMDKLISRMTKLIGDYVAKTLNKTPFE